MKMNKTTLFLSILLLSSLSGTLLMMLTSGNNPERSEQEKPVVLSMTASVEIPDSMLFAGERITFDRYDKRERMDRELNSFTYFHSTTMLLFKRANRIFPIIEPILREQGMPDDLKYLALIESSLDPRAVSPARAAGLWQFMQSTAREHGLEVTATVDERYHIGKSTLAACRYLKSAYRKQGSWRGAALSYNGGQRRITSEMREQRAEDPLDLWLVEETTRYYYRMLAAKILFENPQRYGFVIKPDHLYKPIAFNEVEVNSTIPDLALFAKEHSITYAQLKEFNSWLRSSKLSNASGKSYTLLIPTRESLYYHRGEPVKVHDSRWVVE